MLLCGNEAVCVIGCASRQVVLDSHPEFLGGSKLTNKVGELQAMCCAVLWLIEQNRMDASMRLFDLAANTQRLRQWERSVARQTLSWYINSDSTGNVSMRIRLVVSA